MIKDEFNNIEVTNDKQVGLKEFGKTQKSESTSFHGNKIPEEEFNKKIKFDTHPNHTNVEIKGKTQEVVKVTKVASASTASSIGAATASVATVGAVVAVTAISVVTGISVALHDYEYKFNSLLISANEVTYDLSIIDNKEKEENYEEIDYQSYEEEHESLTFSLRLYNANYDYTHTLWLGSNYGTFEGLTLGETYNIVLSESRYGGEKIFEKTLTTYKASKMNSFDIFQDADFTTSTINVMVDYIDDDDSFSDFTLTLSNTYEPDGISFPLKKTTDKQEVMLVDQNNKKFDLSEPCSYIFSYKNKGEVEEFQKGEITFFNIAPETSEFYEFIFDGSANFITNEFFARLDYMDDLNIFSDFKLILSDATGFDYEIPLEKNKQQQTFNSKMYDIDLSSTYTYRLVCLQDGVEAELDSGVVTFYDISGGVSELRDFIFDGTANFLTKKFEVQLDYQDDFGYFTDFRLIFDDEIVFTLNETTEPQTINCSEFGLDFFLVEHSYVLKYSNYGVDEIFISDTVLFTDTSGAVSEFNGLKFDKKADFIDRTFDIALDYQDDFELYSEFQLTINDLDTSESKVFALEKTTDIQTLTINEIVDGSPEYDPEYVVDIVKHNLTYSFSYKDSGSLVELIKDEELVFTNSNPSTFDGVESPYCFLWDPTVGEYFLPMRFLINDVMEIYNSLQVELYCGDEVCATISYNPDQLDDSWFYGTVSFADGYYGPYDFTSSNEPAKIKVTGEVYDERTHGDITSMVLYEEQIFYGDSEVNEFYGVNVEPYITLGDYHAYAMPVFTGDGDDLKGTIIFETESGKTYTYNLEFGSFNQYSTIDLQNPKEGNFNEETFFEDFSKPVKISVSYCTIIYEYEQGDSSNPIGSHESSYTTVVCYDSFLFSLSA